MTTDNVLDICDNLNDLEIDFNKWNLLTDDQKRISNDFCLAKYGITNIQLYEKQKAKLTTINEAADLLDKDSAMTLLNQKMEQTRIAMNNDPINVVIIPVVDCQPFSVDVAYHRYQQLPQFAKNISNSFSLKIWGVTVDEAYKKVKSLSVKSDAEDGVKSEYDYDLIENAFINIENILEGSDERISLENTKFDYSNDIPQMVPLLTYTEYCSLFPDKKITVSDYINISEPKKYYTLIENFQIQLESTTDKKKKKELEDSILQLGWFPYRRINAKSVKDAKERQTDWYNDNMQTNIIDLTDYEVSGDEAPATTLSTEQLIEGAGITGDKSRLEPLFLTFTSSNNLLGKIIKKWTKSYWSHAGIALNSKLDKIYTFSAKELNENNKQGGFRIESLDLYSSLNINDLLVLCFFVDKDIKKKVKEELAFYEKNQANTKYDKMNYFNIAFNIQKDDQSMQMVCSQFVDYILKLAGIDITNKASNLVTPGDLSKTDSSAINIYALFEGKIPNYKQKEIDKKIKFIVDALDYDKLCATTMENMKSNVKNTKVMESFLEVCTDNEEINSILREVRSYMNPDSKLIEINPENIKELCYRNHKELMECSYSDIDSIKVLLYENRGLATYMKENDEKLAEEYLDKLSSDFDLYKNLIAEAGEPDLHNLKGFAKYYADRLANYDFKYDGLQTV